jgi:rhamnogalacturonan endolyase
VFNVRNTDLTQGTVYKGELAVGTQSVIVSAGAAVTSNIHDTQSLDVSRHAVVHDARTSSEYHDPQTTAFIWKIGEFDGRPTGFLNADLIQTMQCVEFPKI